MSVEPFAYYHHYDYVIEIISRFYFAVDWEIPSSKNTIRTGQECQQCSLDIPFCVDQKAEKNEREYEDRISVCRLHLRSVDM